MDKDIKKLKELFHEHHKNILINNKRQREEYIEEHGEPVPDHMNDNFCLCEALEYMCECIESCMRK